MWIAEWHGLHSLTLGFFKKGNRTRLKCCTCLAKWRRRSPKCCAGLENCKLFSRKRRTSTAHATRNNFRRVCAHVKMSGNATLATEHDITTCLETINKERFCSFPQKQCDGSSKRASRDETCWSIIDSISRKTSQISYGFSFEFDVFPRFFFNEFTAKSTFRAKLPSRFVTCYKMPRVPRNLHFAHDTSKVLRLLGNLTWEVSKVLRLPRKRQRIF